LAGYGAAYASFKSGDPQYLAEMWGAGNLYSVFDASGYNSPDEGKKEFLTIGGYIDALGMREQGILFGVMDALDL
jgi:hypothetical protein